MHATGSILVRHHRLVFFSGLYVAYVVVLFGIAGVHDPAHASRSLARLASPAVELGFAALLCAGCLRMARRGRRLPWILASGAVALVVVVVYLAQCYSLYLSRNFISVLAMQNADSVAFVESPALLACMVVAGAWTAMFWIASWKASAADATRPVSPARGGGGLRDGAVTAACGLCFTYLLFIQGIGLRLEAGFRQSPVANLAVNLHRLQSAEPRDEVVYAGTSSGAECFDYQGDPVASAYPFERRQAFQAPLPFPRRPAAPDGPPNVIVVFAEGVSARMVGAYGGRYPGLTPNIDRFAARAMRVDDYFNHTAATFRGLSGQLSSGFSYAGGGGKEGWTKPANRAGLLQLRRQTLPRLADAAGYDTHFFAPHKQERPLIRMLESLGFSKVHTYQSIGGDLLRGHFGTRRDTGALDDQSLFDGLVAFLRQRPSADRRPFFIASYNIGTHAFLGSSGDDVSYGDAGNPVLDKLHNFDDALGHFLRYFFASPYANNTILIVTADHSTYPEPAFRDVAGDDLKPYFVDRIPLLVHDPFHRLPATLDAEGRNSLDLAPTVLQLAGLPGQDNAFLGTSLFESRNFPLGIAAMASEYYMTIPGGVFGMNEIPAQFRDTFLCEVGVVRRFYAAERDNRIVPANARTAGMPDHDPAGNGAGRVRASTR